MNNPPVQLNPVLNSVSERQALSVPAVSTGVRLLCEVPGTLPLSATGAGNRPRDLPLLAQPETGRARSVTVTYTLRDMLLHGVALWEKTERDARGYVTRASYIPHNRWGFIPEGARNVAVMIDGVRREWDEVILFESPRPGLLDIGGNTILTAIALETTTRAYANDPAPMVVLTPTEPGGGLSTEGAEEIDSVSGLTGAEEAAESLMRAYRSAARVGGAVYLEGVSVTPVGWDPKQLQLVEARQNVVLELARLTGIDADRLGVPVTSRTYANAEQDRQDLIDFSQSVLYQAFTERLSMDDVTPRGTRVRFNLDAFLRGDTLSRMQAYALGKPVGAYTTAEIRELENRPPLTPEQEAAIGAAPSAPVPDPNAQ